MENITQEELDRLYSRFIGAKKNSKAYWEAKSDYHLAYANFYMTAKMNLEEAIKDSSEGKAIDAMIQLQKDVENLKTQLEATNETFEEEKTKKDEEYVSLQEEMDMLLRGLGMSNMEWERAKSLGKLPNGQLL